jgi:hypothetical protein
VPVVIDLGQAAGRQAIMGSVAVGAVGLIAIIAGLTGQVDGGRRAPSHSPTPERWSVR